MNPQELPDCNITLNMVVTAVQNALTDDLRREPWRGNPNRLAGHCYVASEALYHLLQSKPWTVKSHFIQWEGSPHWYLTIDGWVVDPTVGQFGVVPDYLLGVGKGFLTREPSKRAQTVIERVKNG